MQTPPPAVSQLPAGASIPQSASAWQAPLQGLVDARARRSTALGVAGAWRLLIEVADERVLGRAARRRPIEVFAVGPGGAEERAEIMVRDRVFTGHPVVERQIALIVVAERTHTAGRIGGRMRRRRSPPLVRGDEAVHLAVGILLVGARPLVIGVDEAIGRVVEGRRLHAVGIGVRVVGRRHLDVGLARLGQLREVVVERPVLEHQDEHVIDGDVFAARMRGALGFGW